MASWFDKISQYNNSNGSGSRSGYITETIPSGFGSIQNRRKRGRKSNSNDLSSAAKSGGMAGALDGASATPFGPLVSGALRLAGMGRQQLVPSAASNAVGNAGQAALGLAGIVAGINAAGGVGGGGSYDDPYQSKIDDMTSQIMKLKYPEYSAYVNSKPIDQARDKSLGYLQNALKSTLGAIESNRGRTKGAYKDAKTDLKDINKSTQDMNRKDSTAFTNSFNKGVNASSKESFQAIADAINTQKKADVDAAIAAAKTSGGKANLSAIDKDYAKRLSDAQASYQDDKGVDKASMTQARTDAENGASAINQTSMAHQDSLAASLASAMNVYDNRRADASNNFENQKVGVQSQYAQQIAALQQALQQGQYAAQQANYQNQQNTLMQALQGLQSAQEKGIDGWNDIQAANSKANGALELQQLKNMGNISLADLNNTSKQAISKINAQSKNTKRPFDQEMALRIASNGYSGQDQDWYSMLLGLAQ